MSLLQVKIRAFFLFLILGASNSLLKSMQPAAQASASQGQIFYLEFGIATALVDRQLIEAAATGNIQEVEKALSQASVNSKDKGGRTALCIAAHNGHNAIVERLITADADVNTVDNNGYTPLHWAANNGHEAIVRRLLMAGARFNTALNGWTPLHGAARNGLHAAIDQLVQAGANINAVTDRGWTPLYLAAFNGHDVAVQLLLEPGADANLAAHDGTTPLYAAAFNGHDAVVELLLAAGANSNAVAGTQTYHARPLHVAAQQSHAAIVRRLLAAGANIEAVTDRGCTPLYLASLFGRDEVIEQLLSAGANVNAVTNNGKTPLYITVERHHLPTAQLLLRNGGTINLARIARIPGADNTIRYAAAVGDNNRVQTLLALNPPQQERQEALLYATIQGAPRTVNSLLATGANGQEALRLVDTILSRLTARVRIPFSPRANAASRYRAIQRSLIRRLPLFEQILRRSALYRTLIAGIRRLPADVLERFPTELRARMGQAERLQWS